MRDRRYVFLVSGERSGSTLTTLLLGAHSQCVAVGESWKVAQARYHDKSCTCGTTPVTDCRFWSEVGRVLDDRCGTNPFVTPKAFPLFHRNLGKLHRKRIKYMGRILERMPTSLLARIIVRVYGLDPMAATLSKNTLSLLDAAIDASGKSVAIESCKDPLRAFGAYRLRPQSVKIIHLVRDGRGVLTSYLGKGQRGSRPRVGSAKAAVKRWIQENTKILRTADLLPREAYLRVRYEDICSAPTETLGGMCEFLGVSMEAAMLDYRSGESHVFSGNQMRFDGNSTIRVDDKWRAVCVGEVLSIFLQMGRNFNEALGYGDDGHALPGQGRLGEPLAD